VVRGQLYGIRATSDALRQLAALLGDDDLRRRTEALIAREEQAAELALQPWREQLRGRKALLYTGGVKSWSVVSALQDLGMTVVATGTRKSTEEDKQRIRELMGDEAVMLEEGNARTLLDVVYRYQADLMIAGGRNMYTAYKARLPFLDINQEREHAYAGYQGIVTLARQLCQTINSPSGRKPIPAPRGTRSKPWQTSSAPINRWRSARSKPASRSARSSQASGSPTVSPGPRRPGMQRLRQSLFYSTFPRPGSPAVDGDGPHLDDYGRGRQYFTALDTLCQRNNPQAIVLLSTGLSEAQGSDIPRGAPVSRGVSPPQGGGDPDGQHPGFLWLHGKRLQRGGGERH
jgi:hypothetical protein